MCGFTFYKGKPLLDQLTGKCFNAIRGATDSEQFFALLCDELHKGGAGSRGMAEAFNRSIARVLQLVRQHAAGEHIYLNAVVTDGDSGWDSVPLNHLVRIEPNITMTVEAIAA